MTYKTLGIVTLCFGLTACAFNINADVEGDFASDVTRHPYMIGDEAPFPFSEAVEVGDLIFLSGQIGNLPGTTDLAPGGIEPETKQTLENIETTLKRIGLSRGDVVKCTIFMADMAEWPAMNDVYGEFFGGDFPARSAFGGVDLGLNARLEIECIAVRP